MAGAMRLGELAHNFETRLVDVSGVPTASVFDSFDEYLDDIAYLLERLTRGEKDVVLPRYQPKADEAVAAVDEINVAEPVVATEAAAATDSVAEVTTTVAAKPSVAEIAQRLASRPAAAAPAAAPKVTRMRPRSCAFAATC